MLAVVFVVLVVSVVDVLVVCVYCVGAGRGGGLAQRNWETVRPRNLRGGMETLRL